MYLLCYLIAILFVVLVTAIVTLYERKILADIQSRRGPSKPGYFGLLQPIADAFKLIIKEYVKPRHNYDFMYMMAAFLSFLVAAFFWSLPTMSFESPSFSSEWTIMTAFLISIIHVFTILFAGWSSNSRYSFLGAIRTSAQLVAYDIVIVLVYLNVFVFTKEISFENFFEIQKKIGDIFFFLPIQFFVFFVALLAETSRHPFDMPEAESELVAGYNVEYSGIRFAMFFLAEYSTVIFSSIVINTIFFGGSISTNETVEVIVWLIKVFLIIYLIILCRGLLPRYRYDQLMEIGWKILIPFECLVLMYNIFVVSVV